MYFAPYVTSQTFQVRILDDAGQPQIEGPEDLELVLRTPINTGLGKVDTSVLTINDSFTDCKYTADRMRRSARLTQSFLIQF